MKRMSTEELKSGMIVARSVIDVEGRTLLTANTKLTNAFIDRLVKLGIESVYIKDNFHDES